MVGINNNSRREFEDNNEEYYTIEDIEDLLNGRIDCISKMKFNLQYIQESNEFGFYKDEEEGDGGWCLFFQINNNIELQMWCDIINDTITKNMR